MTTDKPKTGITLKLENVRLSYPALFAARAMKLADGSQQEAKFSAVFLLNKKKHAPLIAQIEKMIERVALEKFSKKVTLKHTCLRDGNDKEDTDGYGDDIMFVPASTKSRPVVVDRDKTPLTAEDSKIYGGCYVNAGINLFAYSHPVGGKGISAGLRWVQFVKDGESFGGGHVDVDKEIDEITVGDDFD
jgi:hypothetical protein